MKLQLVRGSTSVLFHIFCQDSTSTSGTGKTGLAFGDFSCRYVRAGETLSGAITAEDISSLGTYQAPTANTNIRIKKLDDTNAAGLYEVHLHNDWVNATGTRRSLVIILTASGMAPLPMEIQLTALDMNIVMRGTDSAALASVVGALADAAADGAVTEADTLMKYTKQLINILIGAPGIVVFPSEAAPANGVSLTEVIRAIYADTNAIQGKLPTNKFMGSSDGANDDGTLNTISTNAARLTAARAAVLTDWINGGRLDLILDAILADTAAGGSAPFIED